MRSLLCASRNNDLLRFEFLSSHLAGFRPAGSHCEKSGKSDDTCASARSGCAKQRSLLCPLSERRWRHPLLFAVLDLLVLLDQAKSTEERKCTTEEIDSSGRIPTRRSAAPYLGVEVCGACPQRRASAGGGFGLRGAQCRNVATGDRNGSTGCCFNLNCGADVCFCTRLCVLWLTPKIFRLGIIKLTLASALDFAYLCPRNI